MTDHDIIFAVIFTTLIILLLIAGVAITIFIANRQRIAQEIQIAQIQLDYEKEMRKVLHEVQEQVLTNIGRELHDNIGQLLTVLHLQIERKKMLIPEIALSLEPLQQTLESVTQQVQLLGRNLNSDVLEQNGLRNTIYAEISRLQHLGHLAFHWEHDNDEPKLTADARLMAFRIFQEIMNNTLKYAEAKNVYITLKSKDSFFLSIKDDGVGFDAEQMLISGKGSGLKNIMKRASLANLQCDLIARSGEGCLFTLTQIFENQT